jgi:hypothetical protein
MTGSFTMPSTSSPVGHRHKNITPTAAKIPPSNSVSVSSAAFSGKANGAKSSGFSNGNTPKCSTPLLEHSTWTQNNDGNEKARFSTLPRVQQNSRNNLNGNLFLSYQFHTLLFAYLALSN